MRVFDQTKSYEIFSYDEKYGRLVEDVIVKVSHPKVEAKSGIGHYKETHYQNGGCDREWVWDVPPTAEVAAWDEYENVLVYIPYTAEELKEIRVSEIKSRLSDLSEDFAQAFAGAQIYDLDERKKEFANLHNELRSLLGKLPRIYN